MQLRRTQYETIIEGSTAELGAFGARVASLSNGKGLYLEIVERSSTSQSGQPRRISIFCKAGPFMAAWSNDVSLVIEGNSDILKDFAECFRFVGEVPIGAHEHWDLGGFSDEVSEESLPLVVQVA